MESQGISPIGPFKIVVIGNFGVGKSSLISRFTEDKFSFKNQQTIGIEIKSKLLFISGLEIKVQIHDYINHTRFRRAPLPYYRKAAAGLLVFDICRSSSFEDIEDWIYEFSMFAEPKAKLVLVGNKSDLTDLRAVKFEDAAKIAEKYNVGFLETSVFDGAGVCLSFGVIINQILEEFLISEGINKKK